MFEELDLNFSEDIKFLKEKFINRGVTTVSPDLNQSKIELPKFREMLEIEFSKHNFPTQLQANQIIDQEIIVYITQILSSDHIKKFFFELSNENNKVTLIPYVHIMRNYFTAPHFGFAGWHNDSLGERKFNYCLKRLNSKAYVFGKLSIACQMNEDIGGNIDVASSKFYRNKRISIRQRVSNQMQAKFLKLTKTNIISKINFKNKWISDFLSFLTKPKRLNPKPLQVIAFDSRKFHRGSPISPKGWKRLKRSYPGITINSKGVTKDIDLGPMNKYIIYVHFGNKIGMESYLYDRSRRPEWNGLTGLINEKVAWIKQYQELDIFKKIYPESKVMFDNLDFE